MILDLIVYNHQTSIIELEHILWDTNLFFLVCQFTASYAGVTISNMLYLPKLFPLPTIRRCLCSFPPLTWRFPLLIRLGIVFGLTLNFIPSTMYGIAFHFLLNERFETSIWVGNLIYLVFYAISYLLLYKNIGDYQPFFNFNHLFRTFVVLTFIQIFTFNLFTVLCIFLSTNGSQLAEYGIFIWLLTFMIVFIFTQCLIPIEASLHEY